MQHHGRHPLLTGPRSKRSGAANNPSSSPRHAAGANEFASPGAGGLRSSGGSSGAHLSSLNADLDSSDDDDDLDPRMVALLASPRDDSGVGFGSLLAPGAAEALEEVRKLKDMTITDIATQQFNETKTVLSHAVENSNATFEYDNEMVAQNVLRILQIQRAQREDCLDKLHRAAVLLVGPNATEQLNECDSIIAKIAHVSQERRRARDELKRDADLINERALGEVSSLKTRFEVNANKLDQRLKKASS